jgi:hypothetical protein
LFFLEQFFDLGQLPGRPEKAAEIIANPLVFYIALIYIDV